MSVNLCACQTKKQTNKKDTKTQLTMVLDWTPNTNHTGLYVAEQKGYFADEGLEVEIVLPPDDGATDMVVSGNAEFGIDAQDNLAEEVAGDQNINVTAVAVFFKGSNVNFLIGQLSISNTFNFVLRRGAISNLLILVFSISNRCIVIPDKKDKFMSVTFLPLMNNVSMS